jgi:hypothetical protein
MPVSDFDRMGKLVKKHARRISERLGWNSVGTEQADGKKAQSAP